MTKRDRELLIAFKSGRSVLWVSVMYDVSRKDVEKVIRRNLKPGGRK